MILTLILGTKVPRTLVSLSVHCVVYPAGIILFPQGLPVRKMTMLADDMVFIAPL
jgi:hypothetical protein